MTHVRVAEEEAEQTGRPDPTDSRRKQMVGQFHGPHTTKVQTIIVEHLVDVHVVELVHTEDIQVVESAHEEV